MGHRRLPRQGPAGEVHVDEGHLLGGVQFGAARHGAGAGGCQLLRSAQHDLSVRRLSLRDGHRRRYRRVQGQAFLRAYDCGTRINPMIIEGQVHGGLTEAFAIAMGQEIRYDDGGNVVTGSFMDFFMPTAVETPHWETDFTVTPSPHHPIGAKGVGESPNVGGVPAFSNAVNDAFSFLGSTHIQMPHDYWRNWKAA